MVNCSHCSKLACRLCNCEAFIEEYGGQHYYCEEHAGFHLDSVDISSSPPRIIDNSIHTREREIILENPISFSENAFRSPDNSSSIPSSSIVLKVKQKNKILTELKKSLQDLDDLKLKLQDEKNHLKENIDKSFDIFKTKLLIKKEKLNRIEIYKAHLLGGAEELPKLFENFEFPGKIEDRNSFTKLMSSSEYCCNNYAPCFKENIKILGVKLNEDNKKIKQCIEIFEYKIDKGCFGKTSICKKSFNRLFITQISDNLIFIAYSMSENRNKYLLYDKKEQNIIAKFPDSIKIEGSTCTAVFLERKIYVFGWTCINNQETKKENKKKKETSKLKKCTLKVLYSDLENKEFKQIEIKYPVKHKNSKLSACVIDSVVYIAADKLSHLLKFNPDKKAFKNILRKGRFNVKDNEKFIMSFEKQLFLISKNEIYEVSKLNDKKRHCNLVTEFTPPRTRFSNFVVNSGLIYLTNGVKIWNFNPMTKTLQVLRESLE